MHFSQSTRGLGTGSSRSPNALFQNDTVLQTRPRLHLIYWLILFCFLLKIKNVFKAERENAITSWKAVPSLNNLRHFHSYFYSITISYFPCVNSFDLRSFSFAKSTVLVRTHHLSIRMIQKPIFCPEKNSYSKYYLHKISFKVAYEKEEKVLWAGRLKKTLCLYFMDLGARVVWYY